MKRLFGLLEALWDRPALSLAFTIAVLVLLPSMAWLQYSWIDKVSDAQREIMQTSLRNATDGFGRELNEELTRVYFELIFNRPNNPTPSPEQYEERYRRWLSQSHSPCRLVSNFYVLQDGAEGLDRTLRYDEAAGKLMPFEGASNIRDQIAKLPRRTREDWRPQRFGLGGAHDNGVPLLLGPHLRIDETGGARMPQIVGWTVAELDSGCLEKQVLPEMLQRHFGEDYQVQVVRKADHGVLAANHPSLTAELSSPDASVGVLALRPDYLGALMQQSFGQQGALPLPPRVPRFSGKGAAGKGPGTKGPNSFREDRFQWTLLVKHRAGSLEAAIADVRHRNLLVSFAIVLLLGASTLMLVLSGQRARRLARQQMEFVAGVSHELRTPVTVICSAADNLAQGMVSTPKQVERYGSVIRDEGRRLAEMLEQVLGFAGIQSGKQQIDLQPVDVNDVLERAIAACNAEFKASGCRLDREIPSDLPKVLGDPTSLASCVRNLLSNAVKYGSPGKSIGLRATVAPNGYGPELRISVEDHGAGIEPGELPHIFEPFYRGRRAVSDQIHGAGLGLSIVKQIMDAHDGRVEVDSVPGKGSCFTLRLPVNVNG